MAEKSTEEVVQEIISSDRRMIFLAGAFNAFEIAELARNNDFSYRNFKTFLMENNIDPEQYPDGQSPLDANIQVRIDNWLQRIAHKEQKTVVIIDHFNTQAIEDYLIRSLLLEEILHLSKNDSNRSTICPIYCFHLSGF